MRRLDASNRTMRGLVAASAAAVLTTGLVAGSAAADPDVSAADVRKAYQELSAVNEKVNAISGDLDDTKDEISDLESEIDEQMVEFRRQRDVLGQSVVQQQLDAPLGPTVNLFGSEDPEQFLDGLGAVQALNSTRAESLDAFERVSRAMENRQKALQDRQAELDADRESLQETQAELEAKHEEVEAQYEELNAQEQAEVTETGAAEDAGAADFDVDASGRAGAAIAFARSQIGDRYVYGGTGPDGWDCSGLMQAAFAAAGASIPRVAGAQYSAAQPVPFGSIQPGDLVFYADMSHVGLYIGGGKVIEAANSSVPVRVGSLSYGFSKAARVG